VTKSLRAWSLVALLGCAAGCRREATPVVEKLEVVGPTVEDNELLGMGAAQVKALALDRLRANGHFRLLPEGKGAPEKDGAFQLELELTFTRFASHERPVGTNAEVGARLGIRRPGAGGGAIRYEVAGVGSAAVSGAAPEAAALKEARSSALREALSSAVDQALDSARLLMAAFDKRDDALEKDLASSDGRVREFAARVLGERGNPAAADALLSELKGDDPDEVRRAIGALSQMHEERAVEPLIELAQAGETSFQREILYALGTLGGDEAEAYLYTVSEGHDEEAIREAAKEALDELHAARARTGARRQGALEDGRKR